MLDNRLVAPYFPISYYLAMTGESFRDRALGAMQEQGMSKAELSRKSGVQYHALDKFLKRANATTGIENATAIANALGIKVTGEQTYEELRSLFHQLDEEKKRFVLASVRGLLS